MKPKTPRAICLSLLKQAEDREAHADDLLTDSFKRFRHLTVLDRAFLTELTYGVLRWRGRLDWVIQQFSTTPFVKIEPDIVRILRLGLYQILFLSKTPVSAAVNESAELAKRIRGEGGAGFVNAILRSVLREEKKEISFPKIDQDPLLHIAVIQSHPLWLVQRWIEEVGVEKTLQICTINNQIPPLTLRSNPLKIFRNDLINKLKEHGLNPSPTLFSEEGIRLEHSPPTSELPFLREGLYVIQDEASQLVTSVLDPNPGEKILDACAGPGGKTTHIAQKMDNRGEIFSIDLHQEKVVRIEESCRRLGIKTVKTKRGDATRPLSLPAGIVFDRVLADVPCSGFGTIRKNPDLKWKRREADLRHLSRLQSSILNNLSGYVKREGTLVYSTCTVFREENEKVIERFLEDHPEFSLVPVDRVLPAPCASLTEKGYFKTFPLNGEMDGFFAARMVKR